VDLVTESEGDTPRLSCEAATEGFECDGVGHGA